MDAAVAGYVVAAEVEGPAVVVVWRVPETETGTDVAGEPPVEVALVGEFEELGAAVAALEYTAVELDMAEKLAVFAELFAVAEKVQGTLVDDDLDLIAGQQFDTVIVVVVDAKIAIAVDLGVQGTAVVQDHFAVVENP